MDITEQLDTIMPTALCGTVARTVGMTVSVAGFPAPVGALAEIQRQAGAAVMAEVIGFRDELTLLYPLSELDGVRHGNRVRLVRTARWLRMGNELLGRVFDAQGNAIDGKPQPALPDRASFNQPPAASLPPPADQRAADDRDPGHRRPADLRQGAADGNLCRLGRGQERDCWG